MKSNLTAFFTVVLCRLSSLVKAPTPVVNGNWLITPIFYNGQVIDGKTVVSVHGDGGIAAGAAGHSGCRKRMIEEIAQIHMTEAEVTNNFAAALEKVRQGLEVVVENGRQVIAVLKPAEPPRRKISECIAMLPADSTATIDADFANDVEAAIAAHRESLEPPAWD